MQIYHWVSVLFSPYSILENSRGEKGKFMLIIKNRVTGAEKGGRDNQKPQKTPW